jgi:hypothetical protein
MKKKMLFVAMRVAWCPMATRLERQWWWHAGVGVMMSFANGCDA